MKVLITGIKGQLGNALLNSLPQNIDLIKTNRENFNLNNHEKCKKFLEELDPDWVINCAAYTNVDQAEKNPEKAYSTNAIGPSVIAEALSKGRGKLIQISTDYVFDGNENSPYKTSHKKKPLGVYGASKSLGEDNVLRFLKNDKKVIVLRTSWLMGNVGRNFALTILKLLKEGRDISVIYDQIGSPTTTDSLASACWAIIKSKELFNSFNFKDPIMHWADGGIASWYDIAVSIQDLALELNLLNEFRDIKPIKAKDYKNTLAARPNFSVLDCDETYQILDLKRKHWRSNIKNLLQNIY